ncbi:MAG: methyltransferase domain-containing protein [Actinobacteria bacterium]|nr:methyltransferase domain-containing protein [Actinomycetota bacterium]
MSSWGTVSGHSGAPVGSIEGRNVYTDDYAASYDRLRPSDGGWWGVFHAVLDAGDLSGRRVLDVGCGTGSFAAALAERDAEVWGVDASEEMLAQAWGRGLPRERFLHARAEELPFEDASFERAVMRLVLHQVERRPALRELARVLASAGRATIATFEPEGFDTFWLTRLFPAVARIDRVRFPAAPELEADLRRAGFARVAVQRHVERGSLTREEALARLRSRFISTLRLLDERELADGLGRAERELPPVVEFERPWLLAVGEAPSV